MSWRAIRIDHHETDHCALLLEAVRPVITRFREDPLVSEVVVATHWARGPHVVIAVATDDGHFDEKLLPRARAEILTWLSRSPSLTSIDPDEYALRSREWALSEGFALSNPTPLPNNAVTAVAWERKPAMGLLPLGIVRDHFRTSALDTVWHLLAVRQRSKPAFLAECACMMAAVGLAAQDDRFAFWPTSMRAHVDGYLASDPSAIERFEVLHQRIGPGLARRMDALGVMATGSETHATRPPQFQHWIDRLRSTLVSIDEVVETSHGLLADHDVYATTGRNLAGAGAPLLLRVWRVVMRLAMVRIVVGWVFGRLLSGSWTVRRAAIMKTQTHLQYRILINFIYGILPLLGIGPTERAGLCYIVWRSCETSFPHAVERARLSVDELADRAMIESFA